MDEVTVAWVLLPFHTSAVAEKEETRVLPLMCGSLLRAVPLAQQQRARHEKK